ncbi:Alpha/Beta hydrolase protein [Naematelia encephala]|uniref:triacylglycerol lipase n=1 Tax=Naematelia encephala TaxID=71784 RepID=A0A1Y2AXX2_9TREE|nr:Alpha/Beta hydrolase protein [Naematelia encephala]
MYIPFAASLASAILPFFSPTPATPTAEPRTLSFRPVHAHTHAFSDRSPPTLLFHNATSPQSFLFSNSIASDESPALTDVQDAVRPLSIRTRHMTIRRPRLRPPSMLSWAYAAQRKRNPYLPFSTNSSAEQWIAPDYNDADGDWEDVEVEAPDMTDRQTLITIAKMTSNAYVLPESAEWWPVGGWNATMPVGWEKDADGLRGHVFADPTNSTVIISLKGTSAGVLGAGGPTAKNDKYNDNLLFSCCCARVDFSWSTVCDCFAGGWKCGQTCLEDALVADSVYATVGTNLYNNVSYMYPNANIWLAGHSLGGSLAALIALSFGAPAIGIEAPGERLAAQRLHLPLPPGMPSEKTGITHIYHTADPIPMGVCTGTYSGCYAAGFALESKCHTGQTILYDTVTVKGWAVDVRTHRIGEIIDKVLADPWPGAEGQSVADNKAESSSWLPWGRKGPGKNKDKDKDGDDDDDDGWEKHGGVPRAQSEDDCVDCYRWEFGDWDKDKQ